MKSLTSKKAVFAAFALTLALFVAVTAYAADIAFPPLTGRVVDQVGLLDAGAKQQLTQALSDHEARSGQQVVVAIVSSLQGQSIEDYGYQLGRNWGIGQKDKDTGAILLVAPAERKVRIEVGYGLEGQLTDAKSADIVQGIILPAFKQGKMSQGIVTGTQAMLRVLGDPETAPQASASQPANNTSLASQEIAASSPSQLSVAGLFVLIFIVLMILSLRRRSGFFFLPIGLGGQSWGGGGFGDGGFSGGGGSFGGGGASGSW